MLFDSFLVKNLKLDNRTVMAPMCMYESDENGLVNDFHVIHYATRAIGGVGLIIQEATAIDPDGRISVNDLGIWNDDHIDGLKMIVDTVHRYHCPIGIQINHAGRKARVEHKIAPSAIAFNDEKDLPVAMTEDMIERMVYQFREAAGRAHEAGYDLLELHAAHGYLLFQFLSPLSNKRDDQYKDGVIVLKKVIKAVRDVWPQDKALAIRVSAYEYVEGGITPEMIAKVLNEVKDLGIDLVDVSSGGNVIANIKAYPGYQLEFAKTIKKMTGLPVIGGGMIEDLRQAEQAIKDKSCDLVFYGRLLLRNPYYVINHAKDLNVEINYPKPYKRGQK
ncbi:NADPH dehydrogenase [Mycoplasmatota bacterium]|nr:NADPH dehydrogenase [Mycoplasmatota bacterium]